MIWKSIWRQKAEVYIDDAALLILGINPDDFPDINQREKIASYTTCLDAIYDAVHNKRIECEYISGRQLFSSHCYILKMSSLESWVHNAGMKSDFFDTHKKPSESLSNRERTSFLKIIIGMARDGYRYDPDQSKSPITKEIHDAIEEAGLSLDEDTIRKYLKEAAGLLDQNKPD